VDYCEGLKVGNTFPLFKYGADNMAKEHPEFSLDCPFKAGKHYIMNVTHRTGYEHKFKAPKFARNTNGFGFELPNGKYRFTLKLSRKSDPFVFFMQWELEVRFRMNDENF
jgi:hypothetical protein